MTFTGAELGSAGFGLPRFVKKTAAAAWFRAAAGLEAPQSQKILFILECVVGGRTSDNPVLWHQIGGP